MDSAARAVEQKLTEGLAEATVDPAVAELRPDYRVLLIAADGLRPGPSDEVSERLLAAAERAAVDSAEHPHLEQWREAFRSFGAKPKRTRPSVDALIRRVPEGLPRVDRLTDLYNAVSVSHVLPIGGEDLDRYVGPAQLVRADGTETFETASGDTTMVDNPRVGEVVWRDNAGVTCRRWNWRQCVRTRLTRDTTRAVFILDALGALDDAALQAAGDELTHTLQESSPGAVTAQRLLTPS